MKQPIEIEKKNSLLMRQLLDHGNVKYTTDPDAGMDLIDFQSLTENRNLFDAFRALLQYLKKERESATRVQQ